MSGATGGKFYWLPPEKENTASVLCAKQSYNPGVN